MNQYRKVKPEDEIPVRMLTDNSVRGRITKSKNLAVPKKGQKALMKINSLFDDELLTTEKITELYRLVDVYLDSILVDMTVCAKGCAQCCHVMTDVSYPEALYIEEMTDHVIKYDRDAERADRCGFLSDDNLCTIREFRPLVCRMFHAVDHYRECVDDNEHMIFSISSNPLIGNIQYSLGKIKHPLLGVGMADLKRWFGKC
ncbi:YkgJ family cysteine cluster protein [Vibrio owensii]|uniref:YkgJ family cysteine cluster protein n=1 Tax=Vibrio owensii TaxID=696485 RepID=UPI003397BAF5